MTVGGREIPRPELFEKMLGAGRSRGNVRELLQAYHLDPARKEAADFMIDAIEAAGWL